MADNANDNEMRQIYGDTDYFINSIIDEYGFYSSFIESLKKGTATLSINRKNIKKRVDRQWLDAIETCIPAIDMVTRNHSVGIQEREEVLPIEFSKHINSRSIRHLAQHTDYINSYDGDSVVPSKMLNVFRDETMETYENKFVNTLISKVFAFVDQRYSKIAANGLNESGVSMSFNGSFKFGDSKGKISLSVETEDGGFGIGESSVLLQRLERVHAAVLQYMDSQFVQKMRGSYIRPPVMRINAIVRNKYLSQCLDLWDYLESYEKLGYEIDVEESAETPNEEYIKQLYSMLSLQYMIFDYHLHSREEGDGKVIESVKSNAPLRPRVVTNIHRIDTDDYNVYDTEYRRVVNVRQLSSNRHLSEGEVDIRNAVEIALAADREILNINRKSRKKSKE